MAPVNILYIDDEPDIREVVEISLGLDPVFAVRSCASGGEGLAATADWSPDLILLDVMMPDMDGPTTFALMRERPHTAKVPVVFMTARAQTHELDRLINLGAAGVIAKPFDPMTLPALVRRYAPATETRIEGVRDLFLARVRAAAAVLANLRPSLARDPIPPAVRQEIETIAHDLCEAAAIYGFDRVSADAGAVEDAAASHAGGAALARALDALLTGIAGDAH
jgi:CheY-like chemotaxis protein